MGIHAKYNDGIAEINRNLGGLLNSVGYSRDYGVEFTATVSKTFSVYGHPLIVSATGARRTPPISDTRDIPASTTSPSKATPYSE